MLFFPMFIFVVAGQNLSIFMPPGQQVKSALLLTYAELIKTRKVEKEVNYSELHLNLLETKQTNTSKMETVSHTLFTNSSECQNWPCSLVESNETELSSTKDRELVSILVDFENIDNNSEANAIGNEEAFWVFCPRHSI